MLLCTVHDSQCVSEKVNPLIVCQGTRLEVSEIGALDARLLWLQLFDQRTHVVGQTRATPKDIKVVNGHRCRRVSLVGAVHGRRRPV